MKLLKCLYKAKVPSTALRSLVLLVLKDCLHTLPPWRNRIKKTAALEYAEQGIRVNAVCPGVIQTPMMDRLTGKKERSHRTIYGIRTSWTHGTARGNSQCRRMDVLRRSLFVTGHAMAVDGGFVAR
jgi:NAD(P)-dependent dehydrogenase (short-subunit alcohol dehydrogenase family)